MKIKEKIYIPNGSVVTEAKDIHDKIAVIKQYRRQMLTSMKKKKNQLIKR